MSSNTTRNTSNAPRAGSRASNVQSHVQGSDPASSRISQKRPRAPSQPQDVVPDVSKSNPPDKRHKRNLSSGTVPPDVMAPVSKNLDQMLALALDIEKMLLRSLSGKDTAVGSKQPGRPKPDQPDSDSEPSTRFPSVVDMFNNQLGECESSIEKWAEQISASFGVKQQPSAELNQDEHEGDTSGDEDDEDLDDVQDEDHHSFRTLTRAVQRVKVVVDTLKEVRGPIGDGKVDILCFSSVTKKDYRRLGIEELDLRVPLGTIWRGMGGGKMLQSNAKSELQTFLSKVERKRNLFENTWSEMSARDIINEFFGRLDDGLILKKPTTEKKGKQVPIDTAVIPEFRLLSRPSKKEGLDAVSCGSVLNDSMKTYLNGSTHYFTVLLTAPHFERTLNIGRGQKRTRTHLKKWTDGIADMVLKNKGVHMSILEAKWPGAKLHDHVPQVVAEAVGIHLRTRREFIPFCLSNSYEWTFGVVWARQPTGMEQGEGLRAPFWMTEISKIEDPAQILFVLSALHFWSTRDGREVWNLGCLDGQRDLD